MKISTFKNIVFALNFFVQLGSIWLFIKYPHFFLYVLAFLVMSFCLESVLMLKNSPVRDNWWNLAIFPSIASVALISALTVFSNADFIQYAALVVAWLTSSYWRKVYLFLHEPRKYRLGSLEYLADYGSILVFFLVAISFFGLRDYLDAPFWILVTALAILLLLIFYYYFWSNKLVLKAFWQYLLASVTILCQLAWSIALLPFTYINSAILLTVAFYSIMHLQKLHLQAKLTNEKIRHYFAFTTLTFIIIFLSARWL